MKNLIMLSILCALTLSTYSQNIFNKKSKQEGCISGDCENGQGTYVFPSESYYSGAKYVGEFKNSQMNGQGIMTSEGNKYEGEWKDDNPHGQGTATLVNGENYLGEWENGNRHGHGTMTYADGDKYVGEFKDDEQNGQGTYTYADGTVEKGLWENGDFLGK